MNGKTRGFPLKAMGMALALCWPIAQAGHALAFEIPMQDPDLKIRWDNTVKYNVIYRLNDPSGRVAGGASPADGSNPLMPAGAPGSELDDGDRNFKRGVVSNRVDLLSEFDVAYRKMLGVRLSGAAWYDDIYNQGNYNRSSATINSRSVGAGRFTDDTRDMMGRKAELLDAFVYLNSDSDAKTPWAVRAGKHTVLYGETLFFGANGIAGAQAPTDVIKLLSVPGSQFKEIIRPVGQVSTQIQLNSSVSFGAYYQYQWQKSRLPASGSFLSNADFVGAGAETFFGWRYAGHKDADAGQGGVQLRFKPGDDVEYGLYAARYNDKAPQLMFDPIAGPTGEYRMVYAEKIKTVGASFSTVIADANVAGEVSYRWNAPLVSAPQLDIGFAGNGSSNPLYAVGKTAHVNLSAIYLMAKSALWDGASLLAELAWNRTLSISKNPLALDGNATRDATALRFIFEPQYFQVLPSLDLSMPVGLGYNPTGRSSAVGAFNGGARQGGDFSIGVKGNYQKQWTAALNYTHYFGKEDAVLKPNPDPALAHGLYVSTGAQTLHDRDFISLTVQTTF